MKSKLIVIAMLLVAVLGMISVMPATAATATRTFPDDCFNAGAEFAVTITADDYGCMGAVTETLCDDWEYVRVTGAVDDVKIRGNNISFLLMGHGPRTFTYTVSAPDEEGASCCHISGTLRDYDLQDYMITGAAEFCACGDPDPISATRGISDQTVEAGSTFTVTLTLTANEDIQAPALDENLPTGWAVTEADNGDATYKPSTNEWVWTTAMSSGEARTVIYDVTVPVDATQQDYDITGQASAYDVSPVATGGESKVTVEPETVDPIATRTIPDDCVNAGSEFTVTIVVDNYGYLCGVTETLCEGCECVDVSGAVDDVKIEGNNVRFLLLRSGPRTFTYTVSAPDVDGACCRISGTLRDDDKHDHTVTGVTEVCVCADDPIAETRDISGQPVEAGSTFTVTLTLTANEDIQAPALDENLPAGWTVTAVNNGGATYKAATTEWIWTTAMSSGEARTVIYDVTVPADAASQDYDITGHASAYGVSPVAIGGESEVTVGNVKRD